MIRITDFLLACIGLLITLPIFIIVALLIKLDSKGPVFFRQKRVGQYGKSFSIMKFRTMRTNQNQGEKKLTIGSRDSRITGVGYYIRKLKIDELPQLINVLIGEMSLVGPRPEVPEYVRYYTDDERKVLQLKPGITDWASIQYYNESDILAGSPDPENEYINNIMREKLELNTYYLNHYSIKTYFQIIAITLLRLIGFNSKPVV